VGREQKDELLRNYWSVSPRQMEVSVVLADETWYNLNSKGCAGFSFSDLEVLRYLMAAMLLTSRSRYVGTSCLMTG